MLNLHKEGEGGECPASLATPTGAGTRPPKGRCSSKSGTLLKNKCEYFIANFCFEMKATNRFLVLSDWSCSLLNVNGHYEINSLPGIYILPGFFFSHTLFWRLIFSLLSPPPLFSSFFSHPDSFPPF